MENVDRASLYKDLYDAYAKAYCDKRKHTIQSEVNNLWSEFKVKEKVNNENLAKLTQEKIHDLKSLFTKKKATSLLTLFRQHGSQDIQNHSKEDSTPEQNSVQFIAEEKNDKGNEIINESAKNVCETSKPKYAQEKIQQNISELETTVSNLILAKNSGLANNTIIDSQYKKAKKDLLRNKKILKMKKNAARRQNLSRLNKKRKLEELYKKIPESLDILKPRKEAGRPRVEDDQPGLLDTIINLVALGGAVDERRRTNLIRTCKTLDELTKELNQNGYTLSRSSTYLRLLPKSSASFEGRRHVKTVPVRLRRAQADEHRKHVDTVFATSTIRDLEVIASVLGPKQVLFLSQDDKARVPLGITAANKQSPILMHLEYKVTLPDHDWVVAEKCKLIPSVYAGVTIQSGKNGDPKAVSYSGPTYVSIRSGKHCSSTADTHASDLNKLLNLPEFSSIAKTEEGFIKPVMIITVDGGPDENPRYEKVIVNAINHFQNLDLDALFIATNAPGRSAYNRVERRMAPLSHELAGLVLPHDHFGSHLDSQNRTIDFELEKQNFEFAGETLAEIWSRLVIDEHPVVAEYVAPQPVASTKEIPDAQWYSKHVREAQYCLQIVKCNSTECCGLKRSNLWELMPTGFLIPPYPVEQSENFRIPIPELGNKFCPLLLRLSLQMKPQCPNFLEIPYDYYCPSLKLNISSRCCKQCLLYHASQKSALKHMKGMHKKNSVAKIKIRPERMAAKRAKEVLCILKHDSVDWLDESDIETDAFESDTINQILPITEQTGFQVINSIKDWISNDWEEEIDSKSE